MSQPKKPPISLRIPEATQTAVNAWATKRGIPRNAAYVELIERGLKLVEAPRTPPPKVRPAPAPEPFKTRLKGEWKAP